MPKQRTDISAVISPSDLCSFIDEKIGGRTLRDLANEIGIGESLLSMVRSGARAPSPAVLEALGLEIAYTLNSKSAPKENRRRRQR